MPIYERFELQITLEGTLISFIQCIEIFVTFVNVQAGSEKNIMEIVVFFVLTQLSSDDYSVKSNLNLNINGFEINTYTLNSSK